MQDNERIELLQLNPFQLSDVAHFCNHYPNIEVSYKILEEDNLKTGNSININVTLEHIDDVSESVIAPLFPQKREEGWWLVIGELKTNTLLSIKRLTLQKKTEIILDFLAPSIGKYDYTLYLISDCYMGCDHEYKFSINIEQ
jgi:pre-mRNA-splicing helicase BRR2